MNKFLIYSVCIMVFFCSFSGCKTYTETVRYRYDKIAGPAEESNNEKFKKSSFKNFFTYKTSLRSDFDITYFTSYYRIIRSDYGSSTVIINSSMLYPGKHITTLGNIYADSFVKNENSFTITSYLMVNELVVSKVITLELVMTIDEIKPERYRGTITNPEVLFTLKDKNGEILFDISDEDSFIALEILSVEDSIAYGIFEAQLVGHKEEVYLSIKEGEFWIKI
ncbi:MAG: hypothetical protein JXB88_04660 [Spirochaetales bacterium]|nr:hypothetical protein [Spirochaetales bacterium]